MTNDKNPATKADLEAAIDRLSQRIEALGTGLERKMEATGSELFRKLMREIDAKVHLVNQGIDEILKRLFEIDDRLSNKNKEQDKRIEKLEVQVGLAS